MTWEIYFWYAIVNGDGEPCRDEELNSECDDDLDIDDVST